MARTLRSGKQGVPVNMSALINNKVRNRIRSRELQQKFENMHITPSPQSDTNGGVAAPLVLPCELVYYIKVAVAYIKRLEENKDDKFAEISLKAIESGIDKIVAYRKGTKDLPSDWKFDRATAVNLLA